MQSATVALHEDAPSPPHTYLVLTRIIRQEPLRGLRSEPTPSMFYLTTVAFKVRKLLLCCLFNGAISAPTRFLVSGEIIKLHILIYEYVIAAPNKKRKRACDCAEGRLPACPCLEMYGDVVR